MKIISPNAWLNKNRTWVYFDKDGNLIRKPVTTTRVYSLKTQTVIERGARR
jgi:hypothetical protein